MPTGDHVWSVVMLQCQTNNLGVSAYAEIDVRHMDSCAVVSDQVSRAIAFWEGWQAGSLCRSRCGLGIAIQSAAAANDSSVTGRHTCCDCTRRRHWCRRLLQATHLRLRCAADIC